jgi:hypothetical protein
LVEIGLSSTRRHLQISEHFNLAADQRQTKHLSVNRNFAEALTSEVMACGRTKHTAPSPIPHVQVTQVSAYIRSSIESMLTRVRW